MRYQNLAMAIVVASTAVSTVALAQESSASAGVGTIETVTVTAEKRSEQEQHVPITIQAFSANDLAEAAATSMEDLTALVPGYTGPGATGNGSPHIRGVGSEVSAPGNPDTVATYVDGVYIGAVSSALDDLGDDVQDVEVLKGPQGTLFGRDSTGGLVQITTRNPTQEFDVEGSLGYANYNTGSAWLYINAPVSSSISTNFSIQGLTQGDGWGTNVDTGKPTYKTYVDLALRNKWNVDLSNDTSLQFMVDYELHNTTGQFGWRPIPNIPNVQGFVSTVTGWNEDEYVDEDDVTSAEGLTGKFMHDFGFASLTDTLAYRHTLYDETSIDLTESPIPWLTDARYTTDGQWTNELQLTSDATKPLSWVAGLFYFHDTTWTEYYTNLDAAVFGGLETEQTNTKIDNSAYSGYAQASYDIFPDTTLTGGYRFDINEHGVVGQTLLGFGGPTSSLGLVNASFPKDARSWRIALSHEFSDMAMAYVSWNRGTTPGGYNSFTPYNLPYLDEKLDAYEVGTKLTLFDARARADLSAFHYDYSHILVNSYPPGTVEIYNGGGATLNGVDADFEVLPISNLTLRAGFELLNSQFGNFPDAELDTLLPGGGYEITQGSAKGNALPYAPHFTGSFAANYKIPTSDGSWDLSTTYFYNSGYFFDPGHTAGVNQSAFSELNASIRYEWADGRRYVQVWGTNLTDTQVAYSEGPTSLTSFVALNPPRLFGIKYGMKFD